MAPLVLWHLAGHCHGVKMSPLQIHPRTDALPLRSVQFTELHLEQERGGRDQERSLHLSKAGKTTPDEPFLPLRAPLNIEHSGRKQPHRNNLSTAHISKKQGFPPDQNDRNTVQARNGSSTKITPNFSQLVRKTGRFLAVCTRAAIPACWLTPQHCPGRAAAGVAMQLPC